MHQGDRNTKFFYSVVIAKQSRNHISHLINDKGEAATDIGSIKAEAPAFFESLLNQSSYWNVFPELIVKRRLTDEASKWLSRNVSNEEIKQVLHQMHPDKASGPDGYTASFFQSKWDIVGPDVCKAIHSFFNSGRTLSGVNHTFVTLVSITSAISALI